MNNAARGREEQNELPGAGRHGPAVEPKRKTPLGHSPRQNACTQGMAGGVYGGVRDADRKQERGASADAEEDRTNGVIGQARFGDRSIPQKLTFSNHNLCTIQD